MGDISKHFSRSEFACQDNCGFDTVDTALNDALEDVREHFIGARVTINSGARCKKHNKSVGGGKNSQHRWGKAADFVVEGVHADKVAEYLEWKYTHKYGIGRYNGRTHIDVRSGVAARWDKRS